MSETTKRLKLDYPKYAEVVKSAKFSEERTRLYSLWSHLRGKLHMTKLREDTFYRLTNGVGPHNFAGVDHEPLPHQSGSGSVYYAWTLEDQEAFIAKLMPELTTELSSQDDPVVALMSVAQ